MLLWMVGNCFWAGSELIWPLAGWVADIPFLVNLDRQYNAPAILISTCVMVMAGMVLMATYLRHLLQRRKRFSGIALTRSVLSAGQELPQQLERSSLREPVEAELQGWHALFYVLLFLLANVFWSGGNWFQLVGGSDAIVACAVLVFISGIISLSWGGQILFYEVREKRCKSILSLGGDMVWVAGSIVWVGTDLLSQFESEWFSQLLIDTTLGLFYTAGAVMVLSLFASDPGAGCRASHAGVHSVVICSLRQASQVGDDFSF
ncbi:unnamed protein product [Polarella glacialis]|uniref:Uncharacterized protein n=1 Tax=Polarella glacialis TaxID=89957 RepID=A0A813JN70_POLGL|nr:unnamed protein product [Polarella glacialis]